MKPYRTDYQKQDVVWVNDYGTTYEAKIIGEIEQAGIYLLKIPSRDTQKIKRIMRSPHKIYETEDAAVAAMYDLEY